MKEGVLTNLSHGGCALATAHPVPPGTSLKLHFVPPDLAGWLQVDQAVVRWGHGDFCGIEFVRLSDHVRERLDDFLWNEVVRRLQRAQQRR